MPDSIGKYELHEEVGQGGMATVYRAFDTLLKREVAVKVLHPHLSDQLESRQRFHREAQAVAKLRHDNIIEIHDYSGMDSPRSYIVMEFVRGTTLRAFMEAGPIELPDIAVMIASEVCAALVHAHSLGVIHRDIKPDNIMIRGDGRIKLTDFGIAQIVDVQRLTVTGQLIGSPAYMAPELIRGDPVDARADVFSVGTVLYQMATTQLPFRGDNAHQVLQRVAAGQFVAPRFANPLVDPNLEAIVLRAMAGAPADRYASIAEMRSAVVQRLAESEFSDPRAELAAYFAHRRDYSAQLRVRLVELFLARGQSLMRRRQPAKALRSFNRVLALEPKHAAVRNALSGLQRRRRIRGVLVSVLGVALLASLAAYFDGQGADPTGGPQHSMSERGIADSGAIERTQARSQGDADSSAPDATWSVRDAPGSVDMTPDQPRRWGRAKRRRSKSRQREANRPQAVPSKAPTLRRVELLPSLKTTSISLNGRDLGAYRPGLRYLNLPQGTVVLTFRNDACCFSRTVKIGAGQDPRVLRVKLPWKPSRIRIRVRPHKTDADVAVGQLVGRPNQWFEVPIPSYSTDGRATVDLRVSAPGYSSHSQRLRVRANAAQTVTVDLQTAAVP